LLAATLRHQPALAQTKPKMDSPGEIAAKSQVIAEHRAKCIAEANAKKLSFIPRRSCINKCVKELNGE
jgi:hypothetical protein